MTERGERLVPMALVRDADRRAAPGLAPPASQPAARVAELRRLVLLGHYASEAMMDVVARRLLATGEL